MTIRPSNLKASELCPARAQMEVGLPDDNSELSMEGVLLHDYFANPNYNRSVLKPSQRDLLERADNRSQEVIETCEKDIGEGFKRKQYRETTLSMLGSPFTFQGTPDLALYYLPGEAAIILDLKFGFSVVDRADVNLQTRAYAVLSYDFSPSKKIFVGIIQPRLSYSEQVTLACYLPEDIEASRDQIISIIEKSSKKNARLVAGEEQCQYCRAKLICPAFNKAMTVHVPITADKALSKAAKIAYYEQCLVKCNDEQLAKVLQAIALSKMVSTPANDEARRRGDTDFWQIGKPYSVREIADPQKAISLLSLAGIVTRERALEICSLPLGTIEEEFGKATGCTQKEARDKINKVLASVIEEQPREPKVIRK